MVVLIPKILTDIGFGHCLRTAYVSARYLAIISVSGKSGKTSTLLVKMLAAFHNMIVIVIVCSSLSSSSSSS